MRSAALDLRERCLEASEFLRDIGSGLRGVSAVLALFECPDGRPLGVLPVCPSELGDVASGNTTWPEDEKLCTRGRVMVGEASGVLAASGSSGSSIGHRWTLRRNP